MNSLEQIKHVLNHILTQSKQKIQQHKTVKKFFNSYANDKLTNLKNDLIMHTGVQYDVSNSNNLKKQHNLQVKPISNLKDTSTFFSVKKVPQEKKQNKFVLIEKESTKNKKNRFHSLKKQAKIKPNSFSLNESYHQNKLKNPKQKQQKSLINNFIAVQDQKAKNILKWQQKQQNQIHYLRDVKNQQERQKKIEIQNQQKQGQVKQERQEKLKNYLENHISRPKNSFTFDIQGELLLYSTQPTYLRKQFPPKIRYDVNNQEEQQSFRQKKSLNRSNKFRNSKQYSQNEFINKKDTSLDNYKIQGARGQIFKSSVLKTVNLSRMSLGNNQIDEFQFMKRNDLFNNNHCRQTTSIPFLKVQEGICFKEPSMNQEVSKIDQQTEADSKRSTQMKTGNIRARSSQERARSDFVKYSFKLTPNQTYTNQFFKVSSKVDNFKTTRNQNTSYSHFQSKRPHTTQVGRIRKQNEQLVLSMLQ